MFRAILLLSTLLTGQTGDCVNGNCPLVGTYNVLFDGVVFSVHGRVDPATKNVVWMPTEAFNKANYAAAKALRKTAKPPAAKAKAKSAVVKPTAATGQVADPFPGGVAVEMLGKRAAYTAPSEQGKRFVEEAQAPPEGVGKLHVTVIGSDDERAPVVNDLNTNPAFADLKSTLMIQDYKPEEWAVDPALGFEPNGRPTILIQTAKGANDPKGGRVVYRASDYSMGPVGLAEAVRKADPSYKPGVDPGPSTGKGSFDLTAYLTAVENRPFAIALGVALVVFLKLPRKD